MNKSRLAPTSLRPVPFGTAVASTSLVQVISPHTHKAIDAATRTQVIDALIKEMNAYYVFPDIAKSTERLLNNNRHAGKYDSLSGAEELASALTEDLRKATQDLHVKILYRERPIPERRADEEQSAEEEAHLADRLNAMSHGIERVERLPGNIGYLELSAFRPLPHAHTAITAAMTLVANSNALIIDLRKNGGGDPSTVAFVSSYLFDGRTHLNNLYWRQGDRTDQFWTSEGVPGLKYGQGKDVYVLTSKRTFSAAEEFSYNLKNLKRATIVGEVTRGGANPGVERRLHAHFSSIVPNGRAINPITKTNWEGIGVTPDVCVPAEDALLVTQRIELRKMLEVEKDPARLRVLNDRLAELVK